MRLSDLQRILCLSRSKGAARSVLLVLAIRFNPETRSWALSCEQLADEAGLSIRGVWSAIAKLADLGEIEVVERSRGRGHANTYRLGASLAAALDSG